MPTYPEWDRKVVEEFGGLADYIILHRYVGNDGDSRDYLALSKQIELQIEQINACALYAQAKRKSNKRIFLCFDEWNVWYRERGGDATHGRGKFAPRVLEERYNFEDALVVAKFLMSFIRHSDCVKVANLAQLVNVIAPIVTNSHGTFRQTIFHSCRMISSRKGGISLQVGSECPSYETKRFGTVPTLDCAAILDGGNLNVFVLNRHLEESMQLNVTLHGKPNTELVSWELLYHNDLEAQSSFENPDNVTALQFDNWRIRGDAVIDLPPHSFIAATFSTSCSKLKWWRNPSIAVLLWGKVQEIPHRFVRCRHQAFLATRSSADRRR